MLSDVSSLTDISSDDDGFVPLSKTKKSGAKKSAGQWTLKQVLKAPRTTQYSARTLYEEILNGKVDLDPEYQRGHVSSLRKRGAFPALSSIRSLARTLSYAIDFASLHPCDIVWPDAKQTGLIDSILRNFYIPPVIFAFAQSDDGEEKRTCIDGKQRLTSIQRFMDGQIPYKDPRTNQKFWYKVQPGETGKLLPSQYRQQFAKKQIVCVEYHDISDDAEREIFQRVQLGVALTPAERMQAIPGPWSQLIRDVLADMQEYKMGELLDWASARGRDFQSVASATYLMEKPSASYPSAPVIDKWLQRVTPPTKAFRDRVVDTFAVFRQLVMTKKFAGIFQKPARISPIEFIMSVILIDEHMRTLTLTQLAEAIRRLREDVRSKHTDIRANTKIAKTMHAFIMQRFPMNLKKEPGEKPALTACRENPLPKPREKGKRKRVDSDSDDSDDSTGYERLVKTNKKKEAPHETSSTSVVSKSKLSTARATTTSTPAKSTVTVKTEPKPTMKTDRLAALRAAKAKVGLGTSSAPQAPTPPSTGGSSSHAATPPPPTPTTSDALDGVNMDIVQSILQRSQAQTAQQQQWPGQAPGMVNATPVATQIQMLQAAQSQVQAHALASSQPSTPISSQFAPPQPPPPGMQPPPVPNGAQPGTAVGPGTPTIDPRQNPHRSATFPPPGTPSLAQTSAGAYANSSNTNGTGAAPYLQKPPSDLDNRTQSQNYPPRSMSTSTLGSSGNSSSRSIQRRDSRFDQAQSSYSSGGYRDGGAGGGGSNGSDYRNTNTNTNQRQPPTEPRWSTMNPAGTNSASGRSRFGDSEALGGYTGGINGRDRDSRYSGGGGWNSRGGGTNGTNGK
ncbi:hypothetical protein EW145_g4688 [Phellinidium pouzarii]|uniref:GmrSD restriction endonucleases N-terminal domain-containing protein n=1 Tax=Phellinidium pouzarii TaxID=167371 RepID=A0A4S4L7G8_9AGAM|nr:hypothetical protein EW145_g4688 [Phellinidium pouzarii]